MFRFADFIIDVQRAELRRVDGDIIKLRPKPFDMLAFFVSNAGRVVAKQELMERFWPGVHVGEDSLFQCIREIRAALGDGRRQILRNISGRGYLFEAEVADLDAGGIAAAAPSQEARVVDGQSDGHPAITPVDIGPIDDVVSARRPAPARRWSIAAAVVIAASMVVIGGLAVAIPLFNGGTIASRAGPTVSVTPIVSLSDEPDMRTLAVGVTDRLGAGLARIENIRVVTPMQVTARASLEPTRATVPDYVVNAELTKKDDQGWLLRARLTRGTTGEIAWASDITVAGGDMDADTQQSRLAAALGHPLAVRLNAILNEAGPGAKGMSGSAKVAVEQATASIVHTSRERFRAAQAMLEKALAENPDNIDVQSALAALQLRGIQMVWYDPDEREGVRNSAQAMMERVLRAKPSYVPVLESYCRLLSATNRFVDSLVACARTLSFDPWNGLAIYHIGLGQIFLGRFEDALGNFKLADQYDTPTVSRWTWLLGAGVSLVYLERDAEAVRWLERSLAVTPGTGRTHLTLVAAHQRLGQHAEAQALLAKALELRPGATAENISPPAENTSPVYLEASARVRDLLVEAGLPRR
ncbi:transcriptional regulator CadC [Tardiphaga alba]|uniref:Transcriptional regulator CadC n=1 Tax=Tardiphaga alba TaxID=340268 RepID=A0ABX8A970_9BRAD|nr:winged helix-turn-helix domain-containing protein [Tardiphaga alba]QUS39861.1 transcriptional regulator CadC [Tardiphaga alba]